MRHAQFLVRFDDVCHTMNWARWEQIEDTLDEQGVKPLIAVVPDNQDPELRVDSPRETFWASVREWQAKGWTIAVHGYQHLYVTKDPGIVRINARSEFAGLPREEQRRKLSRALQIFHGEGIEPEVWVAPAHSFDWITVSVLQELGLTVISDGLFLFPHRDSTGMQWIPQQLWRFRKMPFGTWTVCYHHNHWTADQLNRFRSDIAAYREHISTVPKICSQYSARQGTSSDRAVAFLMLRCIRAMHSAGRLQRFYRR
jgi:predicted deacetylase